MPVGNAGGVTLPAANRGLQAKGLTQVQTAVRILEQALPLLGADSDPGRDVIKALTSLSKHIPPGSTSPGVERTGLQTMMQQQRQDQPNVALLRALGQGGPGGAGAPLPAPPPAAGAA
jgi:hypothetical protein